MAAFAKGNRREQSYDVGNLLFRVLSVRSNDDRPVVPGRNSAPAALPLAFASRRPTRRGWSSRRKRLGDAVLQLRNHHGISGLVWRDRVPADALLLAGGGGGIDAGCRRRSCGRDDRLLVRGQGSAQVRSRS